MRVRGRASSPSLKDVNVVEEANTAFVRPDGGGASAQRGENLERRPKGRHGRPIGEI
jgi:hypothetical protein